MTKILTIVLNERQVLDWSLDFSGHGTIRLRTPGLISRLPWVHLGYYRCPGCTLDPKKNPTCPVADVFAQYAMDLADRESCERVKVYVEDEDGNETALDNVALQTVVSELVRLAVFQSGCPIGRRVKQAMAALPPFPSNEQILHAFAGFFVAETRDRANAQAAVEAFMRSLHEVFGYLSKRLEHAGKGDVCMNGLVILASLSLLFSLSAPELIQQEVARVRQPAMPATPR